MRYRFPKAAMAIALAAALLAAPASLTFAAPAPTPPSIPEEAEPTPAGPQPTDPNREREDNAWLVRPIQIEGEPNRYYFILEAEPGEVLSDVMEIENLSKEAKTFQVYGHEAILTVDGKFSAPPGMPDEDSFGRWIVPKSETITIPARPADDDSAAGTTGNKPNIAQMPFTIKVPEGATPGDYDGAVFTSLMTTASQQGETVNLDLRVGVRVHLRVKGEIHPSVRVDDVKVERLNPWWNPLPGDVRLSFRATNTGNVRVTAKAVADVRANYILRKANKTAQREVYTPELLPGSTVVFSIDEPELVGAWAQGPTIAGIWQFGRQTYSVYLVNGKVPNSDARPETAIGTITVWVIPWVPLIVAVLLLALLLRGVYRIVFRRRIEERFERKIARRRAKGRVRYADDPDESAEVAAVVAAAKPAKKVKPAKVDTVTSQVQPVLPGKTKKAGKAGKKGKTAKAGKTDPVATVAEPFDWSSSAPLGDTADLINGSVSPPENPTDQAEGSV